MTRRPIEYPPAGADAHDAHDGITRELYRHPGAQGWVVRYFVAGDTQPYRTRDEALRVTAAQRERRQQS